MTENRTIVVTSLPQEQLTVEHFSLQSAEMPEPGDGEVLLRVILMSIDAANRAWMQGKTYRDPVLAGEAMHTYAIGQIVQSRYADLQVGDLVAAEARWADYVVVPGKTASKLPPHRPLSHLLSVYGIAGKTAYHGLLGVGRPQAGETVVVSAAAGSVGLYVAQIAARQGCRVVGIAGGQDKCEWLTGELGLDACVDHRGGNLFKDLRAACPNGVDVYFDNVGGNVLETLLFLMNTRGRIVCCGAVSQYDGADPSGPRNVPGMIVVKRLRLEGFIVMDYASQDDEAVARLKQWVDAGDIRIVEDIVDGLQNAPAALIGLLAGDNRGKRMVRVSADPV